MERMWKTPTTLEKVLASIAESYGCGDKLVLISEDGTEVTFQILNLQDSTMVQGNHLLKLFVESGGYKCMCYVHMQDFRSGAPKVRVTFWTPHYEELFKHEALTGASK